MALFNTLPLRSHGLYMAAGWPMLVLLREHDTLVGLSFRKDGALIVRSCPVLIDGYRAERMDIAPFENSELVSLFTETAGRDFAFDSVDIPSIVLGKMENACNLALWALKKGLGLFAAKVVTSVSMQDANLDAFLRSARSDYDITNDAALRLVQVACLPTLSRERQIAIIDAVHTRGWTEANGRVLPERVATTAAYVFADHHRIAFDDPAGRAHIAEGKFVRELIDTKYIPWVTRFVHAVEH